jgi:hypothetical protein
MEKIEHEGKILTLIHREKDWKRGLDFLTPDEHFVQVGTWWYDKGKKLDSHVHKDYERSSSRTQESVYVRRGSMRVLLYSENMEYLQDFILKEGDLAIFGYGGHGYEILEDNTQIIESKNGPFISVDADKIKF